MIFPSYLIPHILHQLLESAYSQFEHDVRKQCVFSQIMLHLRWNIFHRCVERYHADRNVKYFFRSQQFRIVAVRKISK